jgi:hypothetical protein
MRNVNKRNKAYRDAIEKAGDERASQKKKVRQNKLKTMVVKGTEIPFDVRRLKVW